MKTVLFVINTMGIGGAEHAILKLLQQMNFESCEVSLFILTGQGELSGCIPEKVNVINKKVYPVSVLDRAGEMRLFRTVIKACFARGTIFRRAGYIVANLLFMMKKRTVQKDKLLWKILADGSQRFSREFDLAVAYLEGGAAYYVASHVKAKKKAAFIHTKYELAGYNRKLDEDCYIKFDHVFAVSEYVKKGFLSVYPECRDCTTLFRNLINREEILTKAKEKGGFADDFDGFRILSVGRLVAAKAVNVSIEAMRILKRSGKPFRWYVLGEGEMREELESKIREYGLERDFVLPGTVRNPFPYYVQCNLYVHTAYYEGRSVAVEEAQILGCAILTTEYDGVREQIQDGIDGRICRLEPEVLAAHILALEEQPDRCTAYGHAASKREHADGREELDKLMDLIR